MTIVAGARAEGVAVPADLTPPSDADHSREPTGPPVAVPSVRDRSASAAGKHGAARVIGQSVSLLAAFLVGFVVFLVALSALAESRTQDNLYKSFRQRLALATAPLGPVAPGTPVALLDIPRLNLHQVVVEGTTSGELTEGPGHRRDSVLPGQAGTAIIMGRRAAFGAPFQRLPDLQPGDTITTTTGQGVATYRVAGVRDSRAPFTYVPGVVRNRLALVTSAPVLAPSYSLIVDADLVSKPQPTAGAGGTLPAAEQSLGVDPTAVLPLALWGQVMILVLVATTWTYARWLRWPAYLVTSPVILAVLWNVYENIARLLPNLL